MDVELGLSRLALTFTLQPISADRTARLRVAVCVLPPSVASVTLQVRGQLLAKLSGCLITPFVVHCASASQKKKKIGVI